MNGAEEQDAARPDLRIVSIRTTDEDAAAVTAVLTAALAELAAGIEADARPSAWQRSQRLVASMPSPGSGAWRGFAG